MEETAYIGLGSNLGDGLITLQEAWKEIGRANSVTTITMSSPYLSEPLGMESDNWFTNSVGKLKTELSPSELLHRLLHIESHFGRRRDEKIKGYQDRTLDLDILYFGTKIIPNKDLTLPHPALAERLFVLEPLAEVALEFTDPVDGLTPEEKLQKLYSKMENGDIPIQKIRQCKWPLISTDSQEVVRE